MNPKRYISLCTCVIAISQTKFCNAKIRGSRSTSKRETSALSFVEELQQGRILSQGENSNTAILYAPKAAKNKGSDSKRGKTSKITNDKSKEKFNHDKLHVVDVPDRNEILCPVTRNVPWEELSKETGGKYTELAAKLRYDMELWDNFQSPLEELPWNSLYKDIRMGAVAMGYDQNSWDCCINHFSGYDFHELARTKNFPNLQTAYKILGWTDDMWISETSLPDSEDKWWSELHKIEQAAAKYLCYEQISWDGKVAKKFDYYYDSYTDYTSMNFTCPEAQFSKWTDLTTQEKFAALVLGFNERSWNTIGVFSDTRIETLGFEDIIAENDWRLAVMELGYIDDDEWDCCVNHYEAYDFVELGESDPMIPLAFNVLGWNKVNWYSENPNDWPPSEFKTWEQLSDFEAAAADYLCYYKEKWNEWDGDSLEHNYYYD